MTSVQEETRLVLLIKGKRTKRQRSASPHMNVEVVSSGKEEATEVESRGATDEDQDMANCLMLLSQGHKAKTSGDHLSTQKIGFLSNKKVASLGLGLGAFQCQTCGKSFQSFQALGGHKASHKKPKLVANVLKCDDKKSAVECGVVGSFLSLQVTSDDGSKKPLKTHECSICKAEFSSGQALGGHMRRHRGLIVKANANATPSTIPASSHHEESIQPTNVLKLDLNLPAPEDEPRFAFGSKDQLLLFAATTNSLIDCHN